LYLLSTISKYFRFHSLCGQR